MEKSSLSTLTPRQQVGHFPMEPGVYLMKDADGTVIYVGKAKALRSRVRSYFGKDRDVKTTVLMERVSTIDCVVCRSPYEALLLENNLIKEYTPRYNINLKDGKSYPVIRITNEEFPRVFRTRRIVQDGSRYYGPFPNVYQLDRYLELIEKLFPLRKCRGPIRKREHPCLYYHIGRCAAVCAGRTSHEDYLRRVAGIEMLLSGQTDELVSDLERRMHEAVAELRFEQAAQLRDSIAAVRASRQEQQVVDFDPEVRDYLAVHERDLLASFALFRMRGGKLLGTEVFHAEVYGSLDEALLQLLLQYYPEAGAVPEKLVIGAALEVVQAVADGLSQFVREELGRSIEVQTPGSPRDESIIHLAEENARRDLDKRVREQGALPGLEELQRLLGLAALPVRIEGFDIAHVDGKHPVASLVSFQNGRPDKASYRRYHMRTLEGGIDDFAAMREVVARRYTRLANEGSSLPDLILIDGGKGQVNAAVRVLDALDVSIPVVGLAKREEELFLPGTSDAIRLPEGSEPLRILQAVRDEAHRFATTFRASLQSGDLELSTLESIPGIGPTRSRRLMERFESLTAIAAAESGFIAAEARIPYEVADAVRKAARDATDRR